jgi:predicted sulfurtransferase
MEIKGTILIGPEGLNGTIAIPFLEEKKQKIIWRNWEFSLKY